MMDLASLGCVSNQCATASATAACTTGCTSDDTSLSLVCEENFGSGTFTDSTAVSPSRMSSADKLELLLLAHALGVFGDDAGERLAEAGQVGAAVALRDVVGEAQHRLVEAVVPRQRELHPMPSASSDARRLIGGLNTAVLPRSSHSTKAISPPS